MKALLRRLGFGRRLQAGAVLATAALSPYAQAQFAGWVARPTEMRAEIASGSAAQTNNADPDALLARFYRSQEC